MKRILKLLRIDARLRAAIESMISVEEIGQLSHHGHAFAVKLKTKGSDITLIKYDATPNHHHVHQGNAQSTAERARLYFVDQLTERIFAGIK